MIFSQQFLNTVDNSMEFIKLILLLFTIEPCQVLSSILILLSIIPINVSSF